VEIFMKKCIKIFFTVMTFLFISVLGETQAHADELNSTDIIDSIEFSDTTLTQGQLTTINVHFSKKAGMTIAPGDTITLQLPPELQGLTEGNGSPRRIALSNLGEALVYHEKIIVTFNENVRYLDHVKGDFTFGVRTTSTGNSEDTQIQTNLGTATTMQTLNIQGQPQRPDNEERTYPFFYKAGDLLGDSGQVRWFLNVNLNKERLASDIHISDQLGTGQIMNPDSFYITVATNDESHSLNAADFTQQGYGTIELLSDTEFTIHLDKAKADFTSFTIMYTTSITSEGKNQPFFDNSYQLNYQLPNEGATIENNSAQVKNIFMDGNADGTLKPQMPQEHEVATPEETTESFETPKPEAIVPDYVEVPNELTEKPNISIPETLVDDSTTTESNETTDPLEIQEPEAIVPDYVEVPNELAEKPNISIPETLVDDSTTTESNETTDPLEIQEPEAIVPDYVEVPNELTEKPNISIPQIMVDNSKNYGDQPVAESLKIERLISQNVAQPVSFEKQQAAAALSQPELSKTALPETGLNKTKTWFFIGIVLSFLSLLGLSYQARVKKGR
jgi:hypothetical protein